MTLREISRQIYHLSVDGKINDEQFTRDQLHHFMWRMLRDKDAGVIDVAVRDGSIRHCIINRWGPGWDEFDYIVPANRAENELVYQRMIKPVSTR